MSYRNCFEKVGVKTCNTNVVYDITKLPGISLESLEKIRDKDTVSLTELVDNLIFRAINRVKIDLISGKKIQLANQDFSLCVGRLTDISEIVPASNGKGGVTIDIIQSEYILLNLATLYFYTDDVYSVDFQVIDLYSNTVLHTFTLDTVAGENVYDLNFDIFASRHSRKIAVVYDLSQANFYKTNAIACFDSCTCSCPVAVTCGCNNVTGNLNLSKSNYTYGVGLQMKLQCSFEKFLCNNSNAVVDAIYYATALEYYDENLLNFNVNKFTRTREEETVNYQKVMQQKYDKAIYYATSALNFCDNCCFECPDAGIRYEYNRP